MRTAMAAVGLLVGARGDAVVLGAEFDAGDILDAHRGAAGIGCG
jgi:hypothetical protein